MSSSNAGHSRNLAVRRELAITIFDSHQASGTGQGVYLSAVATPVPEDDLDDGLAVCSAASRRAGAPPWTRADVEPPARHRLFRATVVALFVLSSGDERIQMFPPGQGG